jgi:hypothetical protein
MLDQHAFFPTPTLRPRIDRRDVGRCVSRAPAHAWSAAPADGLYRALRIAVPWCLLFWAGFAGCAAAVIRLLA